ncbi:hypothetical protein H0H93_011673, partial [Arthromyces matolae]
IDMVLANQLVEAASFSLYFSGSAAVLSTPHLYLSSLATWPKDQGLSRTWWSHFPGIPIFVGGAKAEMALMTISTAARVNSVAFSRDGSRIVSGSDDQSVRVWDASTGKELKVLEGHTGWVNSVAFSSDGSRILSGSEDQSVRVWDATTSKKLTVLEGHAGWVCSVAFSSDGSRIVSASGKKELTHSSQLQFIDTSSIGSKSGELIDLHRVDSPWLNLSRHQ